jgi:hypothetical protein
VAAGAELVELVLPAAGEITGRLFDHGAPADPRRWTVVADVGAWTTSVPLPDLRAGLAADGTFRFPHVAPARYRLRAERAVEAPLSLGRLAEEVRQLTRPMLFGEDPIAYAVEVTAGATATISFDVDPNQPRPGELAAQLHGSARVDGAPLAGLELERRVDAFRWVAIATVAADGSFVVPALPPGEQRLRLRDAARWEDLWEGQLELRGGETRRLDLVLATGTLRGTAAFATGLSTAGHAVLAHGTALGGTVVRRTRIAPDGAYELALPAGAYMVHASGPDGESEPVPVSIDAGSAAPPLRITLRELPVVSGRITADVPLRGALLTLHSKSPEDGDSWRTEVMKDGTFHFGHLKPLVYELELRVGRRTLVLEPRRFDLALGSHRDLHLRAVAAAAK